MSMQKSLTTGNAKLTLLDNYQLLHNIRNFCLPFVLCCVVLCCVVLCCVVLCWLRCVAYLVLCWLRFCAYA